MNPTPYNGRMSEVAEGLRVAARMAHIEPFEVMEIQTLARELEARGRDVIHLEIGEPDFRTPRPVVEAAKRALDSEPMYLHLGPGAGAPAGGDRGFYAERYRLEVPAERVVVTAGSSAALLLAFGVLLDPGDEVLLADPGPSVQPQLAARARHVPRPFPSARPPAIDSLAELARRNWGERRAWRWWRARPIPPARWWRPRRSRGWPPSRASARARSSPTKSTTASPTAATRAAPPRRERTSWS